MCKSAAVLQIGHNDFGTGSGTGQIRCGPVCPSIAGFLDGAATCGEFMNLLGFETQEGSDSYT